MSGRPLPVADLPAGTVTIRLARQLPANAVPDVDVVATVTRADGTAEERKGRSGADGRATFEGLPPGATFTAQAVIDGETVKTTAFMIAPSGGIRVMLIAGLGTAPSPAAGATGEAPVDTTRPSRFQITALVSEAEPAPHLPAGSLEVSVADAAGKPVPGHLVNLGQVARDSGDVRAHEAITDANGVARFADLPTGDDVAYMVATDLEKHTVGSAFGLPAAHGMRTRLVPLERTSDPSRVTVHRSSRLILEMREEFLFVAEVLAFHNAANTIFDPGLSGFMIPLPKDFQSAQSFGAGITLEPVLTLEPVPDHGMLVRTAIPPTPPRTRPMEARFGFLLQSHGDDTVAFAQKMPRGIQSPLVIIPDSSGLKIEGNGVKALAKDKDAQGNPVSLYELPDVAPGGMLEFTVTGMPVISHTGKNVTAVLAALLALWGVVGAWRRQATSAAGQKLERRRAELSGRREKLFADLIAHEETRPPGDEPAWLEKRRTLVGKLEEVYRDLAAVEGHVEGAADSAGSGRTAA
jgi:hypothetical protein